MAVRTPVTVNAEVTGLDLDPVALQRLRRFGGDKLVHELVQLFLQHSPDRLSAARAGLLASNANVVKASLHALKASAGQLGALAVQRLCEEGEREASNERLDRVARMLVPLEDELARARRWLSASTDSQ